MNYYNPYFSGMSYTPSLGIAANTGTGRGLFSSLFGGGKISTFINGAQKTLNIINQAIPIVKQVSPVMKNAKTMFKVMNEFKRVDNSTATQNNVANSNASNITNNATSTEIKEESVTVTNSNGPTFFL